MAVVISSFIQRLVNTPGRHQLSRAEYKRVRLAANLSFTSMAVALIYAALDVANGVFYSMPGYAVLFSQSLLVLFLLRSGKFVAAKVTLMIAINLVVFYAAVTDPFESGALMLFIPASATSFAVFQFRERLNSFYILTFSMFLFTLAYLGDFRIPIETPSKVYLQISFIVNFLISTLSSALIVQFITHINNESEDELIEKEKSVSQANDELRRVNAELDRFVYSVSHDLRSPLTSIMGLANLAKQSQDIAELKTYTSMIEMQVKAQDQFIKEIIDFSRNERTAVRAEEVNWMDLVNEVIDSLRYQPDSKNISFLLDGNEGASCKVDKTRLRIVLSNLIGNAIKYRDKNKPNPFVKIAFTQNTHAHFLHIQDNGVGIAEEHIPNIFDMFYRASLNSTGSGLGLYIATETLKKMGASITVNSKIGEGSTFTVQLPRS